MYKSFSLLVAINKRRALPKEHIKTVHAYCTADAYNLKKMQESFNLEKQTKNILKRKSFRITRMCN